MNIIGRERPVSGMVYPSEMPLEIEFQKRISEREIARVEEAFTRLNFKIIASSRLGLSVVSDKETIERVFKSKIDSEEILVKGGLAGERAMKRIFFAEPPQIPETIRAFVKVVKFPPPIIPLSKEPD